MRLTLLSPLARCCAALLALGSAARLAAVAAADQPAPGGETVVLPDFTVKETKELPPPESWQYGRLEDGTEVLSNASARATQGWSTSRT